MEQTKTGMEVFGREEGKVKSGSALQKTAQKMVEIHSQAMASCLQ
jgi:hypothetical protein